MTLLTTFLNKQPHNRYDRERGAVLITVLLIVVVLSSVAVALVDDIRFGIRRAANVSSNNQANWYALSAETFALEAVDLTRAANPNKTSLDQPWATNGGQFPVEGGLINTQLIDSSNCFNVNSLVTLRERNELVANEIAGGQLTALIVALGFAENDAEALTAALTDWIDSDGRPVASGAEDFEYTGLTPPYRTANTLIGDVSELRAIRGFDRTVYNSLRPFLCALPVAEMVPYNVNTLPIERAILISTLVGEQLSLDAVASVLAQRPSTGYTRADDFWNAPEFSNIQITPAIRAQTDVKTDYFTLTTEVVFGDAYVTLASLIEASNNGSLVVSRRFGEEG